MAAITYDGQSFTIDGRRIWLVAGTIDYTRCPHQDWASRVHAAKSAGLNTIVTSIPWSRHEPRQGQFDFSGDANLRQFVETVGAAGMYCVLRIGPFVGAGFDLGGLPPWVLTLKDVSIRTQNQAFLEACSRFIGAVARQVRDLQAIPVVDDSAVAPRPVGPIVLIQNESGWRCGHDDLARGYLGELNRYLHESGFEVPVINANDLWSGVEGEVDCWTGRENLLVNLRQLAQVRPTQPRLLMEYRTGEPVAWGGPGQATGTPVRGRVTPERLTRDLCECLCAGAQFNIEPFFGGTNFGFTAGRLGGSLGGFTITSNDLGAPLSETGAASELLPAVRRVSMFASRFGRVLSHLDPRRQTVSVLPEAVAQASGDSRQFSVVHCSGSQGGVVFVFAAPSREGDKSRRDPMPLLLPDGQVLPVHTGGEPVSWCLLDVRLAGRSQLDYCNLTPFALVGRVFVCAGPPGTAARLSINGSPLDLTVPAGDEPEIIDHENIVVVITSTERLGRVQVSDDGVYIGARALSLSGEPVVSDARDEVTRIAADGAVTTLKFEPPGKVKKAATPLPPPPPPPPVIAKGKKAPPPKKPAGKKGAALPPPPPPPPPPAKVVHVVVQPELSRAPTGPRLDHWTSVAQSDYLEGTSARYASIAGPADLNALGAPYGYGWYRLKMRGASARKVRLAWPQSGDRLHLFINGKGVGVLGDGPGAVSELDVSLPRGDFTLVALAENMGRFSGGQHLGERKGAFGHAMSVSLLRTGKPELERGDPIDVLAFKSPIQGVHRGDDTDSNRLTWTLPAKRGVGPVILRMKPTGHRGLVLVNDTPLAYFDHAGPSTIVIEPERFGRGAARIAITLMGDTAGASVDLIGAVSLWQCDEVLTSKAEWAFAKWEAPTPEAIRAGAKRGGGRGDVPTWHHAEFTAQTTPATLVLDTAGLTKGQIYVNARHLGRYFTASHQGKAVGPQTQFVIPSAFLNAGRPNDLLVFDEHGAAHGRVRLFYRV